jgi:hypothetical protein
LKLRVFQWLLLPAVLASANALYGWGSLTLLDDLGPVAERSARHEAALTWTYMQGGRRLIDAFGAQSHAVAHAEALFAPARPAVLSNPVIAMDRMHRADYGFRHRLLIWSHGAAPLLWLATAVAYAMRQRPVVSTRRLR